MYRRKKCGKLLFNIARYHANVAPLWKASDRLLLPAGIFAKSLADPVVAKGA
jgi:hypothetical protein